MTDAASTQQENDLAPLELIAAFLSQEGWPCEPFGEQMLLRSHFTGSHGTWICYAHYRPEAGQYLFYSVAPQRVPEVLRPAAAEYLTRANWGLVIGNFELDYSDGEVRFKTSIQLDSAPLTATLLRPLIFGNVAVMDKYLPGLQAVIALAQTPAGAIAAIETHSETHNEANERDA
jgi:hypothetical protein